MRDILVTIIFIVGCFKTLKKPYYGILLWSWLSYMNPHRLTYGFAYSAPFAYITAIILLFSMIITKEAKKPPINGLVILVIFFVIYMGLTTLNSYFPVQANTYYIRVLKIEFVVFLTLMLITDLDKLNKLLWAVVFTLLTGGGHIVFGPPGSMIEGNNELAVATLMIVPLMYYLYQIQTQKWIKYSLLIAIACSLFTILGTQSRGAFLAILVVGFFYWSKSQSKIKSALAISITGAIIFSFMPESWYKIMDTIQTYQTDGSAMGRINAWHYAFNAANDNFLGMGYESWTHETFAMYAPNPADVHVAHSIYFSVLADHGWLGLVLFLLIYLLTWIKLGSVIKAANNNINFKNYLLLAKMLQVSLIAYLVGGAFLSLSYYDLPWHIISFAVLIEEFLKQKKLAHSPQLSPQLSR